MWSSNLSIHEEASFDSRTRRRQTKLGTKTPRLVQLQPLVGDLDIVDTLQRTGQVVGIAAEIVEHIGVEGRAAPPDRARQI